MSKAKKLEQQIKDEILRVKKEKIILEDELDNIKENIVYYKRKNDFISLDKAVKREREINHELLSFESQLITLESKLRKARHEEKIKKQNEKRKNKQNQKQKVVKKQMDDVLKYMKQGKTRSQAASLVGISESKIVHWCHEGDQRINKDFVDFYKNITAIEKQQEKNIQNNLSNDELIQQNIIKGFMDNVLKNMQNGETRQQAADSAGVKISVVNEWYSKGSENTNSIYYSFYKNIKKIEFWQNKESQEIYQSKASTIEVTPNRSLNSEGLQNKNPVETTSLTVVQYCQNCGKKLNENDLNYCSECGKSLIELQKDYSHDDSFGPKSHGTGNALNFGKCCSGLFVMFIIISILIVII